MSWAIYGLAQKQLQRHFTAQQVLFMIYVGATVLLLPTATPSEIAGLDGLQLGMFAFCCANTLVAYGAFVEALYYWDVSRVSAVIATAPLFTLGAMWLVEWMGLGLVAARRPQRAVGGRRADGGRRIDRLRAPELRVCRSVLAAAVLGLVGLGEARIAGILVLDPVPGRAHGQGVAHLRRGGDGRREVAARARPDRHTRCRAVRPQRQRRLPSRSPRRAPRLFFQSGVFGFLRFLRSTFGTSDQSRCVVRERLIGLHQQAVALPAEQDTAG